MSLNYAIANKQLILQLVTADFSKTKEIVDSCEQIRLVENGLYSLQMSSLFTIFLFQFVLILVNEVIVYKGFIIANL